MRTIDKIIIHCTATPAGREVTVAEIDRWHRQRGFRCIGYHYVIDLQGRIHTGRPLGEIGAHCKGHNTGSVGIAYVGGLTAPEPGAKTTALIPADTRTPAQRTALRELVGRLRRQFPGATVHPHYEFAAKACPCFNPTTDL